MAAGLSEAAGLDLGTRSRSGGHGRERAAGGERACGSAGSDLAGELDLEFQATILGAECIYATRAGGRS
jgi:hypothetical protein